MPDPTNPFCDLEKQLGTLPSDHPARQQSLLTPFQSMVYPGLYWFFNTNRFIGQGRTYLLAVVAIELAKEGATVKLNDLSQFLVGRGNPRTDDYFARTVNSIIREHYKEDHFEFRFSDRTLRYTGRKPR